MSLYNGDSLCFFILRIRPYLAAAHRKSGGAMFARTGSHRTGAEHIVLAMMHIVSFNLTSTLGVCADLLHQNPMTFQSVFEIWETSAVLKNEETQH